VAELFDPQHAVGEGGLMHGVLVLEDLLLHGRNVVSYNRDHLRAR